MRVVDQQVALWGSGGLDLNEPVGSYLKDVCIYYLHTCCQTRVSVLNLKLGE